MSYSIFPDAIDGYEQLPLAVDTVTEVDAESVNRLRCAIINIENALGVNPNLDSDTVRAYLIGLTADVDDNILDISDIEERLSDIEDNGVGSSSGASFLSFTSNGKVPVAVGIKFFSTGDVMTSSVPIIFGGDVDVLSATIILDVLDAQEYQVSILKDSVVAGTLVLPSSTMNASVSFSGLDVSSGEELSFYIERVTGALQSTFSNAVLLIEIRK